MRSGSPVCIMSRMARSGRRIPIYELSLHRSYEKGLQLGFINEISLQDARQFCPPEDIDYSKNGQMKIRRETALKNMES